MRTSLLSLLSLVTVSLAAPQLVQHPLMTEAHDSLASPFHTLADRLTAARKSSIYYGYIRSTAPASLQAQLVAPPPAFTTLLVPTDSAILSLARKPHQGPPGPVIVDVPEGFVKVTMVDEQAEEEAREAYLGRWLQRHAIEGQVDLEGEGWEGREYSTMDGFKVSFALGEDGQTRVLNPGGLEVVGVVEVSGGDCVRSLWVADHSLSSQSDNGRLYHLAGTLQLD